MPSSGFVTAHDLDEKSTRLKRAIEEILGDDSTFWFAYIDPDTETDVGVDGHIVPRGDPHYLRHLAASIQNIVEDQRFGDNGWEDRNRMN